MVIFDTSIIIDHLRQPPNSPSLHEKILQKTSGIAAISIITIQELYQGHSTKNPTKEKELLSTISSLEIITYTYETAKLAGAINRDSPSPIEFADAAIAATCITNSCQLATLNRKHFHHIPNLEILALPN